MPDTYKVSPPLSADEVSPYCAGDIIIITGEIFTARDAAHKRIVQMVANGENPPVDFTGAVIYYVGPTPAPPGRPIGSAGPTTSYRMDPYTEQMLEFGAKMFIGKGARAKEVREALVKHKGVYCAAIGGAAALISQRITAAEVVAFPELGPEAVRRLTVEEFPVVVVNDTAGGDLFQEGMSKYRKL
jgi:fumarate hydratase subunit beta